MTQKTVEERKKEILEHLKKTDGKKIILFGKAGTGKTWMAKELSNSCDSFDITIWVFMDRKYEVYEHIARQFSLLSVTEEWDDDEDTDAAKKKKKEEEGKRDNLVQEINAMLAKKRCLLILDGEGDLENENEIVPKLKPLLQKSSKVLITRRERTINHIVEEEVTEIEVEPLTREDSLTLLNGRAKIPIPPELADAIIQKSGHLPAAIIAIAEALRCAEALRINDTGCDDEVRKLERILEEAASGMESAANEGAAVVGEAARNEDANKNLARVLRCGYDMLPNNVMTNCCWHISRFFLKHGGIHYNELITYWLIEGYFDPIDHVEEAYEEGHRVLMKLIDRGLLKRQEDNVVIAEGARLNMIDDRRVGFAGTARLGLPNMTSKWIGPGRVTQMDGMMKTLSNPTEWNDVSSLLIDGNCLSRVVPQTLFKRVKGLKCLALFKPRLDTLPDSLFEMDKLLVLVLRGCDLLRKIHHIQKLRTLTILELSGAIALDAMPDDLFEQMVDLQSLNLSSLLVTSLPASLFNLTGLRWLILRDCTRLEALPSLSKFKNLEVLDLSGATSFKKFQDRIFAPLQELQTLDLSCTSIVRLPLLRNLKKLSRLLLRGCKSLTGLPYLNQLSVLQILDLSGCTMLKELLDKSMENKNGLKVLDLSKTPIIQLPFYMGNLSELYLSGCSNISKLPSTDALKKLKILDLSDASSLVEFGDQSFEHLRYLHRLVLSKAKELKTLPSLSKLHNLRQLLITDCEKLVELSLLKELEKLEVFDLSGCKSLTIKEGESFEHMSCLWKLNLSETKIECLPSLPSRSKLRFLLLRNCASLVEVRQLESLSQLEELDLSGSGASSFSINAEFLKDMSELRILNLSNSKVTLEQLPSMAHLTKLTELFLSGCEGLKEVSELAKLTMLKVLDLSNTSVGSLPSLINLTNLQKLLLRDCRNFKELTSLKSACHLEVLDLGGTGIEEFPYEISELTCLKRLVLPDLRGMQVDWKKIVCLPDDINWNECGLFEPNDTFTDKSSITLSSTKFLQVLEQNASLLEKCFKGRLHLSFCRPNEKVEDGYYYCHGDEPKSLLEIHSQIRHFSDPKNCLSLEIRGSYSFPDDFTSVLGHVENVSLVDSGISELNADSMGVMTRCSLERCTKMESIFSGDEMDVGLRKHIELLWVSNLPKLQRLCRGNMQTESFDYLKHLYLDCCPKLEVVFSSSQLPQNLETLQIKFCDKLGTLFKNDKTGKCELEKLRTLHLLELPELRRIGVVLPSLEILKIRECPQLEKVEEILELGENLKQLSICNVTGLKNICSGNTQSGSLKHLKQLTVESCPALVNAFSSSELPKNLESIEIKFCNKLENAFVHGKPVCKLPKLSKFHLWKLPELKSIGIELPPPAFEVRDCPKLQKLVRE